MPLYRTRMNISLGGGKMIPAGKLDPLLGVKPEAIKLLLERGAISRPASPPLAVLPGWGESRVSRLAGINVRTIDELLDAAEADVASATGVKPATVRAWKREAQKWLLA